MTAAHPEPIPSLYELAWGHSPHALIAVDMANGTIIGANPAVQILLGYAHSELVGWPLTKIVPELERERVNFELAHPTTMATRYRGFHVLHQGGTNIPIDISASGSLEWGGASVVICQLEDMTVDLEREMQLRAEKEHCAFAERQLVSALSSMVAPVIRAMEMRDPYTVGHQSRVAEIAVAIGRDMNLSVDSLEALHVAAQVHDIGKISIPAEILTKPGRLSVAERAIIYEHPEIGYNLLKDIPFPWPVADIVRQHHEKLNGSGYPLGLTADQILPEAKILAVADIVEAMASYRPYRPSISIEVVLSQIESDAGTLLDPDVVRSCAALIRSKRLNLVVDNHSGATSNV